MRPKIRCDGESWKFLGTKQGLISRDLSTWNRKDRYVAQESKSKPRAFHWSNTANLLFSVPYLTVTYLEMTKCSYLICLSRENAIFPFIIMLDTSPGSPRVFKRKKSTFSPLRKYVFSPPTSKPGKPSPLIFHRISNLCMV